MDPESKLGIKRILLVVLTLFVLPTSVFAINTADLDAYWALEETGFNYLDETSGNVDWSGGQATSRTVNSMHGYAQDFGSSIGVGGDRYIINTQGWQLDSSAYTFNAWVYPKFVSSGSNYGALFSQNLLDIWFGVKEDGSIRVHHGGGGTYLDYASGSVVNNKWQMMTLTWDGVTPKVYLDGVYLTPTSTSGTPSMAGGGDIQIATYNDGQNNNWGGDMDEMSAWSATLSASDITDLYNGGVGVFYNATSGAFETPVPPSPVEYYNLSESGSPYASAVSSADLTATNAPTQTTGIIGNGQDFDGTNDCIGATISDLSNLADELTINTWVKTSSPEGDSYASFIYRSPTWTSGAFGLRSREPANPGQIVWEQNALSSNGITSVSTTTLTDGNWHMVTAVIHNGIRELYIDGVLDNSDTYTNSNPTLSVDTAIGCRGKTGGRHYAGVIDEVGFWDRPLNPGSILWLYQGGSPTSNQQYPFSSAAPNTNPTITAIANQTTREDTPITGIAFTIGDAEDPASALTMSGTSSNASLVNTSAITFFGAGANRTGSITPMPDAYGNVTIGFVVTDTSGGTNTSSFNLEVLRNYEPVLTPIADQSVYEGQSLTGITFNATDQEDPSADITVWATSNNQSLIKDSEINVSKGAGDTNLLDLTAEMFVAGTATITVFAEDTEGDVSNTTFNVTVNPIVLGLDFTNQNVSGYYAINGGGGNFTNVAQLILNSSILTGNTEVTVIWNENLTAGTNQQFKYYYTSVIEPLEKDIYVEEPNLEVNVRVSGGAGGGIDRARVESQILIGGTWLTTYSELTDSNGRASLLIKAGYLHRFVAVAEDYVSAYTIVNTPTGFAQTVTITMEPDAGDDPRTRVSSSCGWVVREDTTCDLEIIAPYDTSQTAVNITDAYGVSFYQEVNGNILNVNGLGVNSTTGDQIIKLYLNGVLDQTLEIDIETLDSRNVQILPVALDFNQNKGAWFFAILILAGGLSVMLETKLKGSGIVVWPIVWTVMGVLISPWLIIPAVPIILIAVAKMILEYTGGKA